MMALLLKPGVGAKVVKMLWFLSFGDDNKQKTMWIES
jgi:hypothetical protein